MAVVEETVEPFEARDRRGVGAVSGWSEHWSPLGGVAFVAAVATLFAISATQARRLRG